MVQSILNFLTPARSEAVSATSSEPAEAPAREGASGFQAELASAEAGRPAERRVRMHGNCDAEQVRREAARDAGSARVQTPIDAGTGIPAKPQATVKPQPAPHCAPAKPEKAPHCDKPEARPAAAEASDSKANDGKAGDVRTCGTPATKMKHGAGDSRECGTPVGEKPVQTAQDGEKSVIVECASTPAEPMEQPSVLPNPELLAQPGDGEEILVADSAISGSVIVLPAVVPVEGAPVTVDPAAVATTSADVVPDLLPGAPAAVPVPGMAVQNADPAGANGAVTPALGGITADAGASASDLAEQLLSRALAQDGAAGKLATDRTATDKPGADAMIEREAIRVKPDGTASLSASETATGKGVSQRLQLNENAPRHSFAEWVNDFAATQGASHRSGDLVGSLDRATSPAGAPASGSDALRPTPLQVLPIEIGMQAARGVTRFQIRLDPAELGRVDVQLDIRDNGEVHASLVVDRVETLAMLKRDASTLQYAFEQAGLKQSADGLTFSLRGENQQGQNAGREGGQQQRNRQSEGEPVTVPNAQIADFAMRRVLIPNSSIDRVV